MDDFIKVLVGVPDGMPDGMKEKMREMFQALYTGNEIKVYFVGSKEDFLMKYHAKPYELVVCFDGIRYSKGYSGAIGRNTGLSRIVVLVPNECLGDSALIDMIQRGFTDILFQKDFNLSNIRKLLNLGRTRDEALMYCGVDLRPVKVEARPSTINEQESDSRKTSQNSIKRRYIGQGIAVTQLLGQDARLLKNADIDDDEFDLDQFSGFELTEEEENDRMPYKEYPVDEEWVSTCKDELKNRFVKTQLGFYKEYENGHVKEEDFRNRVHSELLHMGISQERIESITESFIRDIKSYGKLDVLVHDKNVSDIRLMNKDTINIQSRGVWCRTNITYRTNEEYEQFIRHICQKNNINFNLAAADVVFPDETSFKGEAMLRVSATNANLNVDRVCTMHIRITRKEKLNFSELVNDGFMGAKEASFLANIARRAGKKTGKKGSMIICGGSGSGKTILLNGLIEYWPKDICGEIVQESSELFAPRHLNIKSSNSIESKGGDSKVEYDLKALSATALLRNTDVYAIGEIKGDEAASFYTASRTTSVYTTTHSDNCFGAIPRIAELALAAKAGNTKEEVMSVLANTIEVVVYCEKYKVKQIAEVKGYDEKAKDILYHLYDFHAKEGEE